ncbi:MAG: TolC family protein [Bacteroidales bacterium]|nr:TolC family protein [Bacteroidales bacterium]
MKNIFLLFVFSIFIIPFSLGQEPWSLENCIKYALENNISIKQQAINTEYNSNVLQQSKINLAPNLNAGANHGWSFGRALDQTTYEFTEQESVMSTNVNVNSRVTLFNGLQQLNTIKQNEFNLMASLQDLEKLKNDISLFIASAYLQILFNRELLAVSQSQLETTHAQVERTQKLVDAGSLAYGALLEIKAQEASEELNVVNAQNQLDMSFLNLTQILDLDSVGDFDIIIPEFGDIATQEIMLTVGSVYRDATTRLPQIKSAEFLLSSSEKGLEIAQGNRSPSLSMSGSFGTGYSDYRQRLIDPDPLNPVFEPYPFWDQMVDNRSTGITLGLSVPIFNGWMVNTGISNARLGVMNSKLNLDTQKNNLYKEIQQSYADAVAARKRYLAAQEAVTSMEEAFKYTENKFEVGLINTVDYTFDKNRLTATQSDQLQAKYDYIFKMKILDFYRGMPLSL